MSSALEARAIDGAAAAAETAAAAAARAGIRIEKIEDLDGVKEVSALLRNIWGPEDRDLISVTTLRALAHSDNYLFGAYADDEMVGAITGFIGFHEKALQIHSHILGVTSSRRGKHVGFALKEHQRAWALDRGIGTVTWTFDPLVSRNAYFNLVKLGAVITAYYPSFYGPLNDGINGDDDSDRVLVVWALDSARAVEASLGSAQAPDLESLTRSGAEVVLQEDQDQRPVVSESSGATILVGVPRDIVELRRTNPDVAREWRRATRDVLSTALNDGYQVASMTRAGYYVLERIK